MATTPDKAKIQRGLELRKAMRKTRPYFQRQDQQNWMRLQNQGRTWRRPRGSQSKLRKQHHGHGKLVNIGYGSPGVVHGVHRSGVVPVIVSNEKALLALKPGVEGAMISSTVGGKKRLALVAAAQKHSIAILNVNMRDTAAFTKKMTEQLDVRKKAKKARFEVRKSKVAQASKKEDKKQEKKETQAAASEAKAAPHAHESQAHDSQKEQEKKDFDKLLTKRDV